MPAEQQPAMPKVIGFVVREEHRTYCSVSMIGLEQLLRVARFPRSSMDFLANRDAGFRQAANRDSVCPR